MEGDTIIIEFSKETAQHLENFLQVFMPTYKFKGPMAGQQSKAFDELYNKLRKAIDATHGI
jgi:hypothetical protein